LPFLDTFPFLAVTDVKDLWEFVSPGPQFFDFLRRRCSVESFANALMDIDDDSPEFRILLTHTFQAILNQAFLWKAASLWAVG
jgi:hypothetical protein